MSTATSFSVGLPPPHRGKRSSPAAYPIPSPALSPSLSPLALPPQPKRPRKAIVPAPLASPPSDSSPSRSPPSTTGTSLPPPPPSTYFCYLLRSLSPRHSGHTYIGFTTDPLRRLRQHNGDITSGAYRTARRRPWQLVAAVSGFTSKVIALQFEWQWTYPRKSKRMRAVMEGRRWGGGVRGKVEVMYELLATQPWQSMPLQVRYADEYGWGVHETIMKRSDKERREWEKVQGTLVGEEERRAERMRRHIYAAPTHMPLTVGAFEQLDMYAYRRWRRERRKGGDSAVEVANVTPGEYGESDLDDGVLDDERMESGEESDNSGESDVEIIEQTDNDDDDWTGFPLTQRAAEHTTAATSTFSSSRHPSSSPVHSSSLARSPISSQLRCGLCFRRAEVDEGGHGGFFSGCDECRFVGHLTCIVQHIFKQMQLSESTAAAQQHDTNHVLTQPPAAQLTSSSALSPPARFASNPASVFSTSSTFPPTMFSSLPSSLPLVPPPSTGTCPTCNTRLSYPLLIERCRYMHEGRDGRRGGDVWYEEADGLSIAAMVREYAGRAGELKAREKEEQAAKKKLETVERKRKRKVQPAAASGSGDDSCSTDTSAQSPKRKRKQKQTSRKKRTDAAAVSPLELPRSLPPPPLAARASDSERDKENTGASMGCETAETVWKKPTASRRVAMQDHDIAPPLFTSSQPAPAAAQPPFGVSVHLPVSLSSDDEVLLVDELPSADKRRRLMAEAAERRLGRSADAKSSLSAQPSSGVSLLAVRGTGGLHGTERPSELTASRDYVQVDDGDSDDDDVLAMDTEAEDELSAQSLSDRLKAKSSLKQLVTSLQDLQRY